MPFKVFQYPLPTDSDLPDLNEYLASHRIATIRQKIVNCGGTAMLIFVVEIPLSSTTSVSKGNSRTDYREQLTTAEFFVFSRLRDLRKKIANDEGVPVYSVFTNAQLAQIVREKMTTMTQFATVEGIGKARLDKYGPELCAVMGDSFDHLNGEENEGKSK